MGSFLRAKLHPLQSSLKSKCINAAGNAKFGPTKKSKIGFFQSTNVANLIKHFFPFVNDIGSLDKLERMPRLVFFHLF
jgi:hypothetical protein